MYVVVVRPVLVDFFIGFNTSLLIYAFKVGDLLKSQME